MLLSDYLYKNPLPPQSIKFAIEDLFPRPQVQLSSCYCHNYFPAHDSTFYMRVAIILSSEIMAVSGNRFMRSQRLKKFFEILMEPAFIIIDKDAGCNMHSIDQTEPFQNSTVPHPGLDFPSYINKCPSCFSIKIKIIR